MEEENFDTVVGEDVELTGSIKNTGSILINGTVKGDVTSEQSVVIGRNAKVEGPVAGQMVQVSGRVDGAITAFDTLEMLPESEVSGDIKAATLNIQPGATFNGTASMETEGGAAKGKSASKSAAHVEDEELEEEEEDEDEDSDGKKPKPKLEVED